MRVLLAEDDRLLADAVARGLRDEAFDVVVAHTAAPGEGGRRTVDEWAPLEGRSANAGVRFRL